MCDDNGHYADCRTQANYLPRCKNRCAANDIHEQIDNKGYKHPMDEIDGGDVFADAPCNEEQLFGDDFPDEMIHTHHAQSETKACKDIGENHVVIAVLSFAEHADFVVDSVSEVHDGDGDGRKREGQIKEIFILHMFQHGAKEITADGEHHPVEDGEVREDQPRGIFCADQITKEDVAKGIAHINAV